MNEMVVRYFQKVYETTVWSELAEEMNQEGLHGWKMLQMRPFDKQYKQYTEVLYGKEMTQEEYDEQCASDPKQINQMPEMLDPKMVNLSDNDFTFGQNVKKKKKI
jgi:hypothetical protein